ncbi:hypothetical protein DBV23_13435 [Edwardsiella ictaluri]|nr:hypothetical protein B6E78_05865 [Edwardsiella ictaluri]AVZ83125.1 hypothetical protein DBV23_13435 [Edwardsiella ictaluri]
MGSLSAIKPPWWVSGKVLSPRCTGGSGDREPAAEGVLGADLTFRLLGLCHRQVFIDAQQALLYHLLTLLTVGLADAGFDGRDRFLLPHGAGEGKNRAVLRVLRTIGLPGAFQLLAGNKRA